MSNANSPLDSLTGALVETSDQLLAMYELASITTQSLDEVDAASEILQRAQQLLNAEAITLQLDGQELTASDDTRTSLTSSKTAASAKGWRPCTSGPEQRWNPDSTSSSNRASTTAQIEVEIEDLSAVLIARRDERPFGTADHKLLAAVATMALGAIRTSRHHHDALSRAVMERDHDTAAELAQLALPRWRPALPGIELFARSTPARSAGGDLFTFATTNDTLHFVVGDVSGKGLPAAMMMTTVLSAASAAFQSEGPNGPGSVLSAIDRWVHDYLSEAALFVTLVAGSLNTSDGVLRIANAGHAPVLFVSSDEPRHPVTVDATVPPIGVLPLDTFGPGAVAEVSVPTSPGSRLVVASDGFTEQVDLEGRLWGDDRLAAAIIDTGCSADTLGPRLFEDIERYAAGAEQSDDRTLLILDVLEPEVTNQ